MITWLFYPPSKPPRFHRHAKNADGTWTLEETHPRKPQEDDPPPPVMDYWKRHYGQCLIIRNALAAATDPVTRQRLAEELVIGERKIAHWERHALWSLAEATQIAADLKLKTPTAEMNEVGLTIANRWRVKAPKLLDPDSEVEIDDFMASGKVTRAKFTTARPRARRG